MITTQDKELLAKKGITEEQIAEQLACFQTGFPFLKLDAAASIEKGILAPDAEEQKAYLAAWDAYTNTDKTVVKFVPASGAASRMFKNLFEFLSADYDQPTTKFEQAFFLDYFLYKIRSDRKEVNLICHSFGCLYGSNIRIDKNGFNPFFFQGFECLRTGIVKLTGLTDLQGTGTQQQYFLYIFFH